MRDEGLPLALVLRAVVRDAAVAARTDGDEPRAVVADVTVNVGVDEVLRGAAVLFERLLKLIPVARAVQFVEGRELCGRGRESRPAQGVSVRAFAQHDGAVARDRHLVRDDFGISAQQRLADFYLFAAYLCVAPARGRLVAARVLRVELLTVDVLHVGPEVRQAPSDALVVPDDDAGRTRCRDARDAQTRRAQVNHVPDRGR